MQFKYPELLYALLLLLIPIIVHLFQLRRFKEVSFTNVAFLKEVTLQTRKSSQLKRFLILLTRLLLLACIVFAFAQPFTSNTNNFNRERETIIYLDNSFSMQAKGAKGELLKRALQDIISNFPEDETFTLFTNSETYRNTTLKAIKNDLLQTAYSSNQLDYDALQLKAQRAFSKGSNSLNNFIIISDFQQKQRPFKLTEDTLINNFLVQLKPVNTNNIYVDTVYISKVDVSTIQLNVRIKNIGEPVENLPISLYDGDKLLAKNALSLEKVAETQFDLPINQPLDARLQINDNQLQFDNELYFNINAPEKIKVLSINDADDSFFKRVYTQDEFMYASYKLDRLNYSDFASQNMIILNELKSIPNSLITALHSFTDNGGVILTIPSNEIALDTYNQLVIKYNLAKYGGLTKEEKRITTINYAHPLYAGVFDKKISNFQYPKVNNFYKIDKRSGSFILEYEDGNAFLQQNGNSFLFTAALNTMNSNFVNSPLIVPTLYNIAKQSLKLPNLYYTIGNENSYDVSTSVQQDNILKLAKDTFTIIPQQQPYATKVRLTTNEEPSQSGIYNIMNGTAMVQKVSYNFTREESNLIYHDLVEAYSANLNNSVSDLLTELKSDTKINALWKWFVIFALIFLIMEMLILKYIK